MLDKGGKTPDAGVYDRDLFKYFVSPEFLVYQHEFSVFFRDSFK